jgi:pimeloyl-ACP methyl ester carboxylesterase
MLREGAGDPLVLLHGVTGSCGHWQELMPLLSPRHDTVALDALGHRGGRAPASRPVSIAAIVDDAERSLDELGFDRPHLAGNSLGGWMALELARRGRARSVTAISPAGTWPEGANRDGEPRNGLRDVARDARRYRRLLPVLMLVPRLRRFAMRKNAVHGERMSRKLVVARTDDLLACTVLDDVLDTSEHLAPLDPTPCPITIAWGRADRVLPLKTRGACARELVPGARFLEFDSVGHVAMFDDPRLVASTILETTGG